MRVTSYNRYHNKLLLWVEIWEECPCHKLLSNHSNSEHQKETWFNIWFRAHTIPRHDSKFEPIAEIDYVGYVIGKEEFLIFIYNWRHGTSATCLFFCTLELKWNFSRLSKCASKYEYADALSHLSSSLFNNLFYMRLYKIIMFCRDHVKWLQNLDCR